MLTKNCQGWRPDKPDFRDYIYKSIPIVTSSSVVDLRSNCPPVFDQGNLGCCTANAIAGALQFDAIKNNQADKAVVRSRLFIYYNERAMEGSVATDSGAEIRDGIKSVATLGACNESLWWYNTAAFKAKPNKTCYTNALKYKSVNYMRVPQTLVAMKACLSEGFPIVLGISVYDSFMTDTVAANGMVPMPLTTENMQGGHAILCVGFDDSKQCFIFRNSWGTGWGDGGYGYINYSYLTDSNLCDDLWTIRLTM